MWHGALWTDLIGSRTKGHVDYSIDSNVIDVMWKPVAYGVTLSKTSLWHNEWWLHIVYLLCWLVKTDITSMYKTPDQVPGNGFCSSVGAVLDYIPGIIGSIPTRYQTGIFRWAQRSAFVPSFSLEILCQQCSNISCVKVLILMSPICGIDIFVFAKIVYPFLFRMSQALRYSSTTNGVDTKHEKQSASTLAGSLVNIR